MDASIAGLRGERFSNIKQLLGRILLANGPKSSNCTLSENVDGIVVESTFDEIGQVELTNCRSGGYELAAIIGWEMACFCPFAYEYGVKDIVLGSSNLSFQWYRLFKERAAHLLPQEECHTKLIKVISIIDESKKRSMMRNVGVRFQAKWVERQKIAMSVDARRGWSRKKSVMILRCSRSQ